MFAQVSAVLEPQVVADFRIARSAHGAEEADHRRHWWGDFPGDFRDHLQVRLRKRELDPQVAGLVAHPGSGGARLPAGIEDPLDFPPSGFDLPRTRSPAAGSRWPGSTVVRQPRQESPARGRPPRSSRALHDRRCRARLLDIGERTWSCRWLLRGRREASRRGWCLRMIYAGSRTTERDRFKANRASLGKYNSRFPRLLPSASGPIARRSP